MNVPIYRLDIKRERVTQENKNNIQVSALEEGGN